MASWIARSSGRGAAGGGSGGASSAAGGPMGSRLRRRSMASHTRHSASGSVVLGSISQSGSEKGGGSVKRLTSTRRGAGFVYILRVE